MELIVSDETYAEFSNRYPHISKEDLQFILTQATPLTEYDYWNHCDTIDSTLCRDKKFFPIERKMYSFFIHHDDMILHNLPGVIDLQPNSESIIFWVYE